MSQKHLLPCECGKSVEVERRQAGTTVTCVCGRPLEVPTIRGFEKLAPASTVEEEVLPPLWGLRQGLVFLGLMLALPAFTFAIYLYNQIPTLNENNIEQYVNQLTPVESWMLWRMYAEGMPKTPSPDTAAALRGIQSLWMKINLALLLGVVGLAISASGFFVKPAGSAAGKTARQR